MTRLDPILINAPENIAAERAKAEAELVRLRTMLAEAGMLLTSAKDDVTLWLDAVARAVEREKAYLADANDVADGEIASPYNLLMGAVKRFHDAKANAARLDSQIEEQVQMLADDELWLGGAA